MPKKEEFENSEKHEEDVYDEEYAEELEESDEIIPAEEAFMEGYDKELEKESAKLVKLPITSFFKHSNFIN